jgi:1-acyl-sn-glycerol-3-phosphate acyltransferase
MNKRFPHIYAILFSIIIYYILLPSSLLILSFIIDNHLQLSWNFNPIRIVFGALLIIFSIYITLWATNTVYFMGKGLPIFFHLPKYIVKSGPYSFIRHPLYISFFIYLTGIGLILSPSMVYFINPLFLIFLIFYTIREEKLLIRKFDKEFIDYKNLVPSIIPFKKRVKETPNMVNPFIILLYAFVSLIIRKIFKLKMEGSIERDIGPYIILSNHQSYLDPLFIVSAVCMPVRFITTGKMFEKFIFKLFFLSLGCIPIKRGSGIKSIIITKKALKNGDIVGIFPESSRSWDGNYISLDNRVIKFIKSLGYPIVLLQIDGSYNVLPRWSKVLHRANVSIKVRGEIENPKMLTEEELRLKIEEGISNSKFSPAKWGTFNKYIERLFWMCPLCGYCSKVRRIGKRRFYCSICNNYWYIDDNMKIIPLLYKNMKKIIHRINLKLPMKIKDKIILYRNKLKIREKYIPLINITFLAIDGVNNLQIGIKGEKNIGIKTYDALKLKICIEILRGVKENIDRDPFRF